jgi:hypothetical protein
MAFGMVHLGAIGDLILAMPVAEAIAGDEPIHLMGRGGHRDLAGLWPACRRYADGEECQLHTLFAGRPGDRLRRWLDRCGPRPPMLFAAERVAGTAWINTRDRDGRTHISLQMLRCIRPEAAMEDLPLPHLSVAGMPIGGGPAPVVLHPGSGGVAKCWPLHRFVRTATLLAAAGHTVRWLLGPVERERYVDEQLRGAPGEVHANRPLREVLELLAGCAVYVGNDSGITHAAAALGRPTVALFGPTRPRVWAPRGRRVCVLPFESTPAEVAAACDDLPAES